MAKPRWMAICAASLALLASAAQAQVAATVTVRGDQPGPKIDKNVYGHFVEHLGRGVYEGIWVGRDSPIPNTRGIRNDVVAALKTLQVPVVRWPGGCFADDYHWRDGVGPNRAEGVNSSWGNAREPNTFGPTSTTGTPSNRGIPAGCPSTGSATIPPTPKSTSVATPATHHQLVEAVA